MKRTIVILTLASDATASDLIELTTKIDEVGHLVKDVKISEKEEAMLNE